MRGIMDDARKEMRQLPDIDRLLSKVHSMGIKLTSDHPETRAVYYEMPIYNKRKIKDFTTALRGLGVARHIQEMFLFKARDYMEPITETTSEALIDLLLRQASH